MDISACFSYSQLDSPILTRAAHLNQQPNCDAFVTELCTLAKKDAKIQRYGKIKPTVFTGRMI